MYDTITKFFKYKLLSLVILVFFSYSNGLASTEKTLICKFDAYGLFTNEKVWKSGVRNSKVIFSNNEINVLRLPNEDLPFSLPIIEETENYIIGLHIKKSNLANDNYPWVRTLIFEKQSYETTYMSTNSKGESVYTAKCN